MKILQRLRILQFISSETEQTKLLQTETWDKQAAGCLFFAQNSNRFLIAQRSKMVDEPGTWSTWGGAIDINESPRQTVKRELLEETGYSGKLDIIPLLVFNIRRQNKLIARYHNFLAVVTDEFKPKLNWETQNYKWVKFGQWPQPMHYGLTALLKDRHSLNIIQILLKPSKQPTGK